jgi:hypothetical protein
MKQRCWLSAGALTLFAACADPVGPGVIAGATFSLRPLPPATVPVLMSATVSCDYWLYDGHLDVATVDSVVLKLNTVLDCTRVGATPDTTEFVYTGGASQAGAQLTFSGLPLGPGTVESSRGVATGIKTTLTQSALTLGAFVPLSFGRD